MLYVVFLLTGVGRSTGVSPAGPLTDWALTIKRTGDPGSKGSFLIYSEDFEGSYPGWGYIDGNSDGYFWTVGTTSDIGFYPPPNYGNSYAYYSDDDAGWGVINTNEEWLSPAIGIHSIPDSLKLIYGYGFTVWQTGEILRTDARFYNGAWGSWTELKRYTTSGSGTDTLDLTSYLPSDSIQIRFLYNDEASSSHWGNACAVDNVSLFYSHPWILSVNPLPHGNVPSNEPIIIKFSRDMKPSTLNISNVYLRTFTPGPNGGEYSAKIQADYTYNPFDSTLSINPKGEFLADSEEYFVTITGNVQDTFGIPMGEDFEWSWTTLKTDRNECPYIANSRFKDGLKNWRIQSLQGTVYSQPNTVMAVDDIYGNYKVWISRSQTHFDGGVIGIYQELNSPVGPTPYLYLFADIELLSGYPSDVRKAKLVLHTSKGDWNWETNTIGSYCVASPNLIQELDLTPNDTIYSVWIGNDAYAWSFDIYVDNVSLSYINNPESRVLLLSNEGDFPELRSGLAEFYDILGIDYFSGLDSIPTLSELLLYDAVIVIDGNYGWINDTATGDTLAAFIDRGGGVVMGGVCWDPQPGGTYYYGGLNGAVMNSSYNPYSKGPGGIGVPYSLGSFISDHPIMWDVDSFAGFVCDSVFLNSFADTVAVFTGHTFGIATKQHLVGIPAYWGSQLPIYGDFIELIHNSFLWSIHPFINGDFWTEDIMGWSFNRVNEPGMPEAIWEVVDWNKVLRLYRGSTWSGGSGMVIQRFKQDITSWSYATIKFRVKIDWQEFTGDLSLFKEYPAKVTVFYEDNSGNIHEFNRYFYLEGTSVDPEPLAWHLNPNTWYLCQYDLKTISGKLEIKNVLGVMLHSSGWGFDVSFDDVALINEAPTGVEPVEPDIRDWKISLFPNPFSKILDIFFFIPNDGRVEMSVIDIKGSVIKRILDGDMKKGEHRVSWDGLGEDGKIIPNGVYFVNLMSKDKVISKKVLLMR